ncbi:MAG: hypothetical protein LBK04_02270 [Clostridiales Family XIII bacterium]|nr:hypothetical protein [Clostridiales Family XIII bacterium]
MIDIAYAEGTFGKGLPEDNADYLTVGDPFNNYKELSVVTISKADFGEDEGHMYYKLASELMGGVYPKPIPVSNENGIWGVYFVAPDDPSYNILNAPAYEFVCYPEGVSSGNPAVIVTYGMSAYDQEGYMFSDFLAYAGDASCDPNMGYQVLHFTI